MTERLISWGPRGVCVCESCPLSPPGATQSTPANFAEVSTPARCSAASQATSSRLQLRLLSSTWRSPESQVRARLHTLSNHCGPQPWGSDLPGASYAPPAPVCTASGTLGSLASTQLQQSPGLHNPAQERCLQGSPSASSQCLIPAPTLPVHSSSRPGCALWFTHFAILSMAKGNLVILLQPYGVCSLTPFSV